MADHMKNEYFCIPFDSIRTRGDIESTLKFEILLLALMHHNKISIYVSGLSIFLNPGFSILVEASLFNLGWVTVWGLLVDDQIQCRANRVVETSSRLTLMLLSLLLIFNYLVHTMQNERVLRGCVKDFGRQLPFSVVNVARIVAKFVEFSMPLFFESSFFRFIRNDVSISVIYRSSLNRFVIIHLIMRIERMRRGEEHGGTPCIIFQFFIFGLIPRPRGSLFCLISSAIACV
jgi:hypothetical protein